MKKYPEIIAKLIKRGVRKAGLSSHDRVLITRYSTEEAKKITRELIKGNTGSAEVEFDVDSKRSFRIAKVTEGSTTFEILPFVVVKAEKPPEDAEEDLWAGTRGFATSLRTNFHKPSRPGIIRVLLVFDQNPVETQASTSSQALSAWLDSLDHLIDFLKSSEIKEQFERNKAPHHKPTLELVDEWKKLRDRKPEWSSGSHVEQLERVREFVDECSTLSSENEIGKILPKLGLFFADPDTPYEVIQGRGKNKFKRLKDNAELALQLEEIRVQRLLDPIERADEVFDLGGHGEPFYTAIEKALKSTTEPISNVTKDDVYYEEVKRRERGPQQPAKIDNDGLVFVSKGDRQHWQSLRTSKDTEYAVVVSCPGDELDVTLPMEGNIRGWIYQKDMRNGKIEENPLESKEIDSDTGRMEDKPECDITFRIKKPKVMSVTEIRVLPRQRPQRGRQPNATSRLLVGVIAGDKIAIPEEAKLDIAEQAYLVDELADSIVVQIGSKEVRIPDREGKLKLPPDGGAEKVAELEIEDVTIRWAGENRSPPETDPDPPKSTRKSARLIDLVGVEATGNYQDARPLFKEDNRLAGGVHESVLLDVEGDWFEDEAKLLLDPSKFAGIGITSDTKADTDAITRVAGKALDEWLITRTNFFEEIVTFCEDIEAGVGGKRPSLYLADLRDSGDLYPFAKKYVEAYIELLSQLVLAAEGAPNPAAIEPVLLCDRVEDDENSIRLAPTHPLAVAFLASIQNGLIPGSIDKDDDQKGLIKLLERSLLSGVLPKLPFSRSDVDALSCDQSTPLLWRAYGSDGGLVDTSKDLAPVIEEKLRRLLDLEDHLNSSEQWVYIDIEIGKGAATYLTDAVKRLEKQRQEEVKGEGENKTRITRIKCRLDIGIVVSKGRESDPDLIELFSRGSKSNDSELREKLQGYVRVRQLKNLGEREAHLAFKIEAQGGKKDPLTEVSVIEDLIRDTGFAAGLSQEAARYSKAEKNEVTYTRYVSTEANNSSAGGNGGIPKEGVWDGSWRRLYKELSQLSRRAAIGLRTAVTTDTLIPAERLRQIADPDAKATYDRSFITVHCDPAQGPEFFVGDREEAGVFLVECSDRGSPELPGRDIVSVTSRIDPFRSALSASVERLPPPLADRIDAEVSADLLHDINLLRGTEVFNFVKARSSETDHRPIMDGLDNVLGMRFFLSNPEPGDESLPIVISIKDFIRRIPRLEDEVNEKENRCDDIIVFYLPPRTQSTPIIIRYRLVEVKFRQDLDKAESAEGIAQKQLEATAEAFREILPRGRWCEERSANALILERDLAWTLHEAIERYRAFGLLTDDRETERRWGLKQLFTSLHAGDFELRAYKHTDRNGNGGAKSVDGTALMLYAVDRDKLEKKMSDDEVKDFTHYTRVPLEGVEKLLTTPAKEYPLNTRPPTIEADPATQGGEGESTESDESDTTSKTELSIDQEEMAAALRALLETETETSPVIEDAHLQEDKDKIERAFKGFIGNKGPVGRLKETLLVASQSKTNHLKRPIGFFGPKSTGKTELARRVAKYLGRPLIRLNEITLRSAKDLADAIELQAEDSGTPMVDEERDPGARIIKTKAPEMIVMIDEVHLLSKKVQDSLLTALEPDDRTLITKEGNTRKYINTEKITFLLATTDPGRLSEAFKSRVSTYNLSEYDEDEIVEMLEKRPGVKYPFNRECLRVFSIVGRLIPRKAIERMEEAADLVQLGILQPEPEALVAKYWENFGADENGLTHKDREYMRKLFPDKEIGVESLAAQLGENPSNLSDDIEPYLMRFGLVDRARGGRKLTPMGRRFVVAFDDK